MKTFEKVAGSDQNNGLYGAKEGQVRQNTHPCIWAPPRTRNRQAEWMQRCERKEEAMQ